MAKDPDRLPLPAEMRSVRAISDEPDDVDPDEDDDDDDQPAPYSEEEVAEFIRELRSPDLSVRLRGCAREVQRQIRNAIPARFPRALDRKGC